MKTMKRMLALFLCIMPCAGMIPSYALAEEEDLTEEAAAREETVLLAEETSEPTNEPEPTEIPVEPAESTEIPEEPAEPVPEEEPEAGDKEEPAEEPAEPTEIPEEPAEPVPEEEPETGDEEETAEEPELFEDPALAAALLSAAAIPTSGDCGVGVHWELNDNGQLNIDGNGDMRDYDAVDNPAPWWRSRNDITSVTIGNYVTTIGSYAFYGCGSLKRVTIGERVNSIADHAFDSCGSLTDVSFNGSREAWGNVTIAAGNLDLRAANIQYACIAGGTLGSYNKWTLYSTGLMEIKGQAGTVYYYKMPDFDSAEKVPWYRYREEVTSVSLSNLETIGSYAFYGCKNLTSLTIDDGITSVGAYSFASCEKLKSVRIGDNAGSVGDYAFYCCTGLMSVIMGDNVHNIGTRAFASCGSLESLTIGIGTESIGSYAFDGCTALADVYYYSGTREQWEEIAIGTGNAPLSAARLHHMESTGKCGDKLIWKLDDNKQLKIEGTGDMWDFDSTGNPVPWSSYKNTITTLIVADGVTSIGSHAFDGCSSLVLAQLPESVTSIGYMSFYACGNLVSADIPENLTSIGGSAFAGCNSLKSVDIPDSVTSIGDNAFSECAGLESVTIGSGAESIGNSAFEGCTGIKSITLPKGVKSIGRRTFYGCNSLSRVDIPDSVTNIADYAFNNCSKLKEVYYGGLRDQWKAIVIGEGNEPLKKADVHCPIVGTGPCGDDLTWTLDDWGHVIISGTGDMWDFDSESNPAPWYSYHEEIKEFVIDSGVTGIGDFAFRNCRISTVELPDSLTSIRDSAFDGCEQLGSITIPERVTSIGAAAFRECTYLKSMELPDSVTSIGADAFSGCRNLGSVDLPSGITGIADRLFYLCLELQNVEIPEGVAVIGEGAFYHCVNIESMTFPEGLTTIGPEAFLDCYSLQSVMVPLSIREFGAASFMSTSLQEVYYGGTRDQWQQLMDNGGGAAGISGAGVIYCIDLAHGECGDDLSWMLYRTGLLEINGTGDMWAYDSPTDTPWDGFKEEITSLSIGSGVTSIGENAFSGCSGLTEVRLPITLAKVKEGAFGGCTGLGDVYFPGTAEQWQAVSVEDGNGALPDARIHWSGDSSGFTLSQSLITLNVGQVKQLEIISNNQDYVDNAVWTVTDSNGTVLTDAPVTVDETGSVTAVRDGIAYVVAGSSDWTGAEVSARCRVDVIEDPGKEHPVAANVKKVSLPVNKATVELYKTDYTRIPVILEMDRLLKSLSGTNALEPQENKGAAIEKAVFTDGTVAGLFGLRVVDDRILEIVPKSENATAVKSSYKSGISVTVDGKDFPVLDENNLPAVLTVTVKKAMPAVKVSALKFNSLADAYTQPLVISGGNVIKLEADTALPEFLELDGIGVKFIEGRSAMSAKGKLYLLATVDGWSVKQPVTVSYSVTPTYPKVTLNPASVTLKPGTNDKGMVAMTVTPAEFVKYVPAMESFRVIEGKEDRELNKVLSIGYSDGIITAAPLVSDGLAHTYKVYFKLQNVDKEYSFTVKTLAAGSKVTLTLKQSGAIDDTVNRSPVTLTVATKNFNVGNLKEKKNYNIWIEQYRAPSRDAQEHSENVTSRFKIDVNGNVIRMSELDKGRLETGYTYYAHVQAKIGDAEWTDPVKVKLNVKWSAPEKVQPAVTLKAGNAIDVIRPGTAITVTPTLKNCFTYVPETEHLTFFKTENKVMTELSAEEVPFDVTVKNGSFILTVKDGAKINPKTEKYAVRLTATMDGRDVLSQPVNLTVKQGSAKVTQSVKDITLYAKDRYSSGEVILKPAQSDLSKIANVMLGTDTTSQSFDLKDLGGGKYAIGYKDDLLPDGFKPGTAKTVKLLVTFEGNGTGTPNVTVSVKVNIK